MPLKIVEKVNVNVWFGLENERHLDRKFFKRNNRYIDDTVAGHEI